MRILFAVLLLVTAGLQPALSISAESATTLFQRGVDRFRSGEFAAALDDFEAAERLGLVSVELIYNFGSVLYRLGDYTRAGVYFEILTDHPSLSGPSIYNLALIAYKLDDRERARTLFRQISEDSRNTKLRALAARQLQKLEAASTAGDGKAID